jgi:hypothetical protein
VKQDNNGQEQPRIPVAVCVTERVLPDDVEGRCSVCEGVMFFRPSTALLPIRKICEFCYAKVHTPGDRIMVTQATLDELRLWFSTRKGRTS